MRKLTLILTGVLVAAAVTVPVQGALADATTTVSGVITGSGGDPIETTVNWFSPTTGTSGDAVESNASTGEYTLVVPEDAAKYYLEVNIDDSLEPVVSGYAGTFVGAGGDQDYAYQLVAPWATATSATVDVELSRSGTISGVSTKIAGRELSLERLDGTEIDTHSIASDGSFAFHHLVPGQYQLSYSYYKSSYQDLTTKPITVTAGHNTEFSLPLVVGARLSGVVRAGGKGVKGLVVEAHTSRGAYRYATTNSSGAYLIPGLPFGSYTVDVFNGTSSTTGYTGVVKKIGVLHTGESKTLDLTVAKAGGAKVTVASKAGTYVQISIVGSGYSNVRYMTGSASAATAFANIPAGTYTIYTMEVGGTKYGKASVKVTPGSVTTVPKIALSHATVTLKGTVSGVVSGDAYITRASGGFFDGADISHSVFTFTGLIPGTYTVSVQPRGYESSETKVAVSTSITKSFAKGAKLGTVRGSLVLGAASLPLYDVDFSLVSDGQFYFVDLAAGTFSESVPAGAYTVEMSSSYTDFQSNSPYYVAAPSAAFSVTSGQTTAIGTLHATVEGSLPPAP